MKIIPRALARVEVIDIGDMYALIRQTLAQDFVLAYERFLHDVGSWPKMYAKVKRCPRGLNIREGKLKKFPYVVTYEIGTSEIVILSVIHGRRIDRPWRGRIG